MATVINQTAAEPEFAAYLAFDWGNDKHLWAAQEAKSGARENGELEARPEVVDPLTGKLPG